MRYPTRRLQRHALAALNAGPKGTAAAVPVEAGDVCSVNALVVIETFGGARPKARKRRLQNRLCPSRAGSPGASHKAAAFDKVHLPHAVLRQRQLPRS